MKFETRPKEKKIFEEMRSTGVTFGLSYMMFNICDKTHHGGDVDSLDIAEM